MDEADLQPSTSGSGPEYWQDLLGAPEPDMFGSRARSASDAAVLRRKGHLKEQDQMIEFMLNMHRTHTSLEVMQKMEKWMAEHRQVWCCYCSSLKRVCECVSATLIRGHGLGDYGPGLLKAVLMQISGSKEEPAQEDGTLRGVVLHPHAACGCLLRV